METLSLRNFYTSHYPTDEMGAAIHPKATFNGLFKRLEKGLDIYKYVFGNSFVYDSLVRERLFERLSEIKNVPYNTIYDMWLNN